MSTFGDLVNEVHLNLLGYVLDQESMTTVTAFTDSALTFSVADATQISTGLIEVDEELMWCTQIDPDANIVSLSVRGLYGTTAAAHATNALCRNAPRFPRQAIANALNEQIRSVYPEVFAVASTNVTSSTSITTYGLPADAEQVLEVTYDEVSASGEWSPLNKWRMNSSADTAAFPTGRSISVFDGMLSGRTFRVTYLKPPTPFAALTDDLSTTGLAESARACLVYGACAKLVAYLEPARFSDSSAEAKNMGTQTAGAALTPSRYFYQMHLQARQEESRRLMARYPARMHFTR